MGLKFDVSASVTLVGKDLQFVGNADNVRVRFVVTNKALTRLGSSRELSPQQKFKIYDRNREMLQEIARRLWETSSNRTKPIKIQPTDL